MPKFVSVQVVRGAKVLQACNITAVSVQFFLKHIPAMIGGVLVVKVVTYNCSMKIDSYHCEGFE